MVFLERDERTPMYERLYRALREEIIGGQWQAGRKLPSKRMMAQQLGISVNTVDAAYGQLASEGYVRAQPRSGFVVCAIDRIQKVSLAADRPARAEPKRQYAVDFDPSGMAWAQFPLTIWQRLAREVFATPAWLERCPAEGDPGLREAVAQYLQKARNVRCAPEQILIGSGTAGLITLLGLMMDRSVCFAVENPVYNRCYQRFARMGHPVLAAEVDRQGVMVEPLEELDHVVLYTTPSHQYPLGICMPMSRRAKLLNWSAKGAFRYIIEDDYDSEFRYDARPVPPLQSIDGHNRTIYLGTFSSTVAPALRIGYMVLPPELLQLYRRSGLGVSCDVPAPEQLILREFLVRGHFERHLNRMRTYYKRQRQFLVDALGIFGDDLRLIGEAAGRHLTVQLRRDEEELCRLAEEAGVKVYPISPYFIGEMPEKYGGKLLLGFGALTQAQMADGAARLYQAWRRA